MPVKLVNITKSGTFAQIKDVSHFYHYILKNMTSISIDANPFFKEKLLELGFVKKKGLFLREVGGVLQSLYFTYRNQGGSSTRYYTFNYGISFSAVECVMEKLGVNTYGAGNSLHLKDQVRKRLGLPRNNSFIEWKIATSDSEKQLGAPRFFRG